jgi:hypothetical protein
VLETLLTIASPFIAAGLAYSAALRGWRRQQRRDVYAQFLAHANTMLEAVDRWHEWADEDEDIAFDVERASEAWEAFVAARKPLGVDLSQLRLVAPGPVILAALDLHYDAKEFDDWAAAGIFDNRHDATAFRRDRLGLNWEALDAFTELARHDLAAVPFLARWRERKDAKRRARVRAEHDAADRRRQDAQTP